MDILANLVGIIHGFWVLTVVVGPAFSWKWPRFKGIHLGMMLVTIIIILSGNLCPLTTLENQLRVQSDPGTAYSGSFIASYLDKILGLQIDPAWVFYSLVGWALLWGSIYAYVWIKNKQRTPKIENR